MKIDVRSPADLVLVTDPAHPRYDPRVTMPPNQARIVTMVECAAPPDPDPPVFPSALILREDGEVVAGRGRVRDMRIAHAVLEGDGIPPDHWPLFLCFVTSNEDEVALLKQAAAENALRDPDDDAYTTGVKLQRLVNVNKAKPKADRASLASLASAFDMSDANARMHMALVRAAPEVVEAYRSGAITKTDALRIAQTKSHEEQTSMLALTPPTGPMETDPETGEPTERERRPGKRGASKVPSVRQRQKMIEALGEGNVRTEALKWTLGLAPGFPKAVGVKL